MTDSQRDIKNRDEENSPDNPGVGGVPADGEIEHGDPDDDVEVVDEEEVQRDNPGVGGLPAGEDGRPR